ncbi:E2 protein [Papillomaviridae sp. Seabass_c24797]|nr:E2 protein [Papillomaviridae sp. Seabass_c24797]
MTSKLQKQLEGVQQALLKLYSDLKPKQRHDYDQIVALRLLEKQELDLQRQLRDLHPNKAPIDLKLPSKSEIEMKLRIMNPFLSYMLSFQKSPLSQESQWFLFELSPDMLFQTEPKHCFKRNGRRIVTTWFFRDVYYEEPEDVWHHSRQADPDKKGWYYWKDGTKLYYHLFPQTKTANPTDQTTQQTQSKHDESPTTSTSPHSATGADRGGEKTRRGRKRGPGGRDTLADHKRSNSETSIKTTEGVAAAAVGSDKRSVRPGAGHSALERLLLEAVDPPGLCISGPIEVLKGIRKRLESDKCPPYKSYTMTTTAYEKGGAAATAPFFLIFFTDLAQRLYFQQNFKVYTHVIVSRVHFNGLTRPTDFDNGSG